MDAIVSAHVIRAHVNGIAFAIDKRAIVYA